KEVSVNRAEKYLDLIKRLVSATENSLELSVIIELIGGDTLSFRALARRLRVNYKRLDKTLNNLVENGLIEIIFVNVSEHKVYKFYKLRDDVKEVLKRVL
ncbi:MAG: hypothetical protein ABWW65_05930, partial [Thermoprotei archaeon]